MALSSEKSETSVWVQITEALLLEPKYHVNLQLPVYGQRGGDEMTMGMRDASAQVLRCLKVWYEFSSDTLFIALNIMDRFLARMRARPRHLSCIAVSSLLLATRFQQGELQAPLTASDLVAISQAQCSGGDVQRMCAIIGDKLGCEPAASSTRPLTAGPWLRLVLHALSEMTVPAAVDVRQLEMRLESVLCCGRAASVRSCELVLALLAETLPALPPAVLQHLLDVCSVQEESFDVSRRLVVDLLAKYEASSSMPRRNRQRLMWRLSHRTLKQLRPTNQLLTVLPTIEESRDVSVGRSPSCHSQTMTSNSAVTNTACRSGKCRRKRRRPRNNRRHVVN